MVEIVVATIINKTMTMKKVIIILISFAAMFISCSKSEVWLDNGNPNIYFPQEGVSFNTAWLLDNNEYTVNFGVYLSGVRPENQNSNIDVTYSLKPSLIDAYNNDNTQQYAGRLSALPADCYEITGNVAAITKGNVSGAIPIRVFTDKLGLLPKTNAGGKIMYTIPLSLTSTTGYELSTDTTMRKALCVIQIDYPRFYFWINRALTTTMGIVGRKVIFGQAPVEEKFRISSLGLSDTEDYTLNFDINAAAVPVGGTLLPSNAYELPSSTLTIPKGTKEGFFGVKILNDNVAFRQAFYLPVRIASASKYSADSVKGTLLLKIEAKNDYEWSYTSKINTFLTSTGRSMSYQVTKSPASYDATTLTLQLSTNGTIANNAGPQELTGTGWTSAGWTGDFVTGFTHTTGNTTVLSSSLPAVIGSKYTISYTVTGRTAGTFTIGFGGQTSAALSATGTFSPTATSAANLTITPLTTFNGKIVISIIAVNSFNDMYYRLKITPNPANTRKCAVELIRITDYVPSTGNSPITLELDPAQQSYYDWDYETFYLNYRWRSGGSLSTWINVSEILEATFF